MNSGSTGVVLWKVKYTLPVKSHELPPPVNCKDNSETNPKTKNSYTILAAIIHVVKFSQSHSLSANVTL